MTDKKLGAAADERACIEWAERHYRNEEWFESAELSVALNAWHQACAYAREGLKAQPAAPAPEYGPIEVVGDMVRNLLTLDQSAPIYAAFHVDYQGKRACRTRPVWVSLERVVDGKWVDSARKDVPYNIIVWAKPQADEKAQPAPTEAPNFCARCGKRLAAGSIHTCTPPDAEAQGESPFKFRPWSKEAEMIEGWTAAERAREQVQGDGGAMADGYLGGMVGGNASEGKLILHYQSHAQAEAAATVVFDMIDRARASAETGGVKS